MYLDFCLFINLFFVDSRPCGFAVGTGYTQTCLEFSLHFMTFVSSCCVVLYLNSSLNHVRFLISLNFIHVHFVTLNTFLSLFSQVCLGIESPLQIQWGMFLLPHHSKSCKQVQWSMWAVYRHQESSAWWAYCVYPLDVAVSVHRVCFGSVGVLLKSESDFHLMWCLFYTHSSIQRLVTKHVNLHSRWSECLS